MGGTIRVESEPDKGTSFFLTLPFEIRRATESTGGQRVAKDLLGMEVLVVDDNATNRRILEEFLTGWGMRPTCVDGAAAALAAMDRAQMQGNPFALALVDYQMPDLDGLELARRIKARPDFSTTMIMMLSSVGNRGDAARVREAGVDSYLTKPVRKGVLLEALLAVLDRAVLPIARPLVARHSIAEVHRALRVLVAEDNAVNSMLVNALLGKRGHTAEIVPDGQAAVAAVLRGGFDLVLMDWQMPVLDGLQATAAIRQAEAASGGHIPIIALTAHAMKGDREACLAAGADGYLSKPLNAKELYATMDALVGGPTRANPTGP